MKTVPLWTDQFPRPANLPTSPLPEQVDVAVIGGGYTGLNAARVIARHGGSVAVLEQQTIGWGASSRNGGMATTGLKAAAQVVYQRYGPELGRLFWQSSLDAIDLIEQIVVEEDLDCDFVRPGHLCLANKPEHFTAFQKKAAWFQETLGHPLRLVEPDELSAEIGSTAFYGGLVDDYSGGLDPAKYVFGLAGAIARRGALLCENVTVERVERQNGGYAVHSNQGLLRAGEVLVATNGYTGAVVPGLRRRIFPIGSYIIVTAPLPPDLQAALSPKGRMFYDSRRFLNYFRLTPDGRMLFGGRNNLSTDLDLAESARRLRERMLQVFPALSDAPITHSWTGRLGLTFDLMPHIGRLDGVHYALGYCGHGVSIATYLGTEAGLLLCGAKQSSPFAQIPHQTRFFHRGNPWFLPLAALYYRFLDWMD
jgi:glycine/D-amino acid oxidase-like deaminating enzyme